MLKPKPKLKKIVSEQVQQAQQEVIAERQKASEQIEAERKEALSALEKQVKALSHQIVEKVIGAEFAK